MKCYWIDACMLFLSPWLTGWSLAARGGQGTTGIQIEDAKLGKDVKDREIVDETSEFGLDDRVYLWMKVAGATDQTIEVTWKNGDHTYTTELSIGGSPWRTWCYKTASLPGEWTVTIADSQGTVLKEMSFQVK